MSIMVCNDHEIVAIYSEPSFKAKRVRLRRHSLLWDLIAGGLGIGVFYCLIVFWAAL